MRKEELMNLNEKIIQIRKDNQMSQDDFAEILNVTRQTVSNWENKKNYPDIETLIDISNKFDISLDVLLKEDKTMVSNMNKKIKNGKIFKSITITLALLLFLITLFGATNYYHKQEKIKREEQKYHSMIKKIKELGFLNDGIGFSYIEEDGIIYKVFTKKSLPIENSITASTATLQEEEAIFADYDGERVRVTYLNENKTTVYCDKYGNLINEAQNDTHTQIYEKYQYRTISVVTRMTELFDQIFKNS